MGEVQSVGAHSGRATSNGRAALAPIAEWQDDRGFSQLVAWSIVCALQKYLVTYSDFRRLGSGALTLCRPTGE